MRAITTDPDTLAHDHGIALTEHDVGPKGWWYPTHRIISLRRNLGHVQRRCTLMHELAHALLDHLVPAPKWLKARQEVEAHQWAARRLITPTDYEAAENLVGSHKGALAHELNVTTKYIAIWRTLHERNPTP